MEIRANSCKERDSREVKFPFFNVVFLNCANCVSLPGIDDDNLVEFLIFLFWESFVNLRKIKRKKFYKSDFRMESSRMKRSNMQLLQQYFSIFFERGDAIKWILIVESENKKIFIPFLTLTILLKKILYKYNLSFLRWKKKKEREKQKNSKIGDFVRSYERKWNYRACCEACSKAWRDTLVDQSRIDARKPNRREH